MPDTDFTINQRPVSISFTCPHCEDDVEIPWDQLDVPMLWQDSWGTVNCPECGRRVALRDWELD